MAIQGGAALPVLQSNQPAPAGAALPIAVVTDGRAVQAGPARSIVVVTDGRSVQAGAALPVVLATGAQASGSIAGPPMPVVVVSGSFEAQLSGASFALQNTATTNDMGPDGYSWPQSGIKGPLSKDQYDKLVAVAENVGGSHSLVYSNNLGAAWSEALSLGFLTRGAIAYNTVDDKFCVLWSGQAATDGILFREYTPTRDGSNNITGFTVVGGAYTQLDAQTTGTMEYQHPAILWLSDIGAHGTIIAVWCCRNTGVGGTGNEIRACMRTLTNDANDLVAANWVHLGVNSATTIGNAPLSGSYTALLANATTGVPHVAIERLANKDLFVGYHTGTVTGGKMAGSWSYRRATWNGTNWPALTAAASIVNVVRSGTDTGYANKGELLSKPVQDAAGNVYLGLATWKGNASGDTWGFAQVTPGDVVTLVDDYSANGAHSYAPTGDIDYDTTAARIVSAYITTTDQFIYAHLFNGTTEARATQLAFNGAPCDIPNIYSRAVPGKLCFLFRDTNTPHKGWFGTMDWNV